MELKRNGFIALLAGVLAVSLAGCAESRSYAIPDEVCGRDMPSSELAALLPSGENFKAELVIDDEVNSACQMRVDGSLKVSLTEYRDQNRIDVMGQIAELHPGGRPMRSEVGYETATAENALTSMNPCRSGKFYTLHLVLSGADSDHREALEEFADSYIPVGLKSMGCVK